MKLFKKLIYIFTLILIQPHSHASELTTYFNDLKTLKATFTQTVFAGTNTPQQESEGFIVVKNPNKFYLEYNKPYKLVYVANGKKLWSYDVDLEQVVVKKQGDILVNTPAMLLSNPNDLARLYNIDRTGESEGWIWFELLPKKQNSHFESISFAFVSNQLKAMEMRDNFGQTTRLTFEKVIRNPDIKLKQFNFIPPKGVDVIGQ